MVIPTRSPDHLDTVRSRVTAGCEKVPGVAFSGRSPQPSEDALHVVDADGRVRADLGMHRVRVIAPEPPARWRRGKVARRTDGAIRETGHGSALSRLDNVIDALGGVYPALLENTPSWSIHSALNVS
jgi:hypothetical protein